MEQQPAEGLKGLLTAVGAAVRRSWAERRGFQSFAYAAGALLIASGIFHFAVFLVRGGPWGGPVSWRKPATFGLSFGLTVITLAWIGGLLGPRRRAAVAVVIVAVGSFLEVFLVVMQRWRGVPSHFNSATAFDGTVFDLMGVTIAIVVLAIVVIAALAFRRLDADPPMALAIRAGLLILLIGQALGGLIIRNGLQIDMPPTQTDLAIFGRAGVMKVPHAISLHAIQVLPALALLLTFTRLSDRRRRSIVWMAAAGYLGLAATAILQTFSGRAPFDLTPMAAGLALISLILGAFALIRVVGGLRTAWFSGGLSPGALS
jgi:hypothetical protein